MYEEMEYVNIFVMNNIAYINLLPTQEYEQMMDCYRFAYYINAGAIRLYHVTNENEIQEIIEMGINEIKDREDDLEDTTKRREMKIMNQGDPNEDY
jgi:hypothetical protein